MSRFDYIKYDAKAVDQQDYAKNLCTMVEQFIAAELPAGRAAYLAVAKLEEVYMWIGKAVRDGQIARNGSAPLQEERKDG